MDITMTIAVVLVGLGGIVAGAVGIRLPAADRLGAALALVVGAGVGVATLAIGAQMAGESPESMEAVFLVASALGFLATLGSLALLWRGVARGRA